MLTTRELQEEIIKYKKLNDICILAHAYQPHEITEIADFVSDSFGLSQKAAAADNKTVLMCGVRFMAETAKILSPQKRVLLSNSEAGCPMAEQLSLSGLKELKKQFPNSTAVAYINTTALLKTECDICVTSASALKIIKNIDSKDILFIPDCNLGGWIEKQVPDKTFHFINGGCPVHTRITEEDVLKAKAMYPTALILAHPECTSSVVKYADYVGSTTGIMEYVKNSNADAFIIGTDNSIVEHLKFQYPNKNFYPLSKKCICEDMRLTTLVDVYNCVKNNAGEEIILSDDVIKKARKSIDNMLFYGG